jgi:septal ring factor EnvC (AmiA/AmiB activator)
MNRSSSRAQSNLLVFLFLSCLFFSGSGSLFAQKQTKKDLENKKKQIQKEIDYTNQLLAETKKNKKRSLTELVALNKKISQREELIANINSQIYLLDKEIKDNNESIKGLQNDLTKLKAEYAKMIYYAYKNRDGYNRLVFVFASKDFEQAYMRLKYLQQYSDYRHKQAEKITNTKKSLNQKVQELEAKKTDKRVLLSGEETEKKNLTSEKGEKEQVFTQLQAQESKLKKDLEKKKKDANNLQQAIQRAIQKELEKAQKEAATENKPKPQKLILTPESQKLSNSFASNKGKLPWPVAKGIISERFGVHPHPLMPNIEINNNGVDITTNSGSIARAVFDGEVKAIGNMPGAGEFVLVRHGEFLTIYANLKDVYVKTGDKVTTKQNLGSILYDEEDNKTVLQFQIWKGQTKLDPESWIFKTN